MQLYVYSAPILYSNVSIFRSDRTYKKLPSFFVARIDHKHKIRFWITLCNVTQTVIYSLTLTVYIFYVYTLSRW